ncbi:MAG: hypothetical protein LVQ75_01890 [Candidatus Babeliales bacterium]|jgi:hypothetical protein
MKTATSKSHSFAEVIESSLQGFTAQSWQWDTFPEFGSLVTIATKKRTLFGVVHAISTGSMEQGRYPFTYQKTEEELLAEQPQIFEFLKTSFSCIILGFSEHEVMLYHRAPEPPKIHAFVSLATPLEYKRFFACHNYLHVLASSQQTESLDELMLALLRNAHQQKLLDQAKLESFIEIYSLLIGNDYRRLKLFIQRIPI